MRRNLLIRTGGLGDCILTLTVASCLRMIFPGSELHFLGTETMLEVSSLAGLCLSDGFHDMNTAGFSGLFTGNEPSPFLRDYFSAYDTVYFFSAADPVLIERTVKTAGAGECIVRNPNPLDDWKGHITEYLLGIIPKNLLPNDFRYKAVLPPLAAPEKQRKGLVIHPGSGSLKKNWPLERFVAVAEAWGGDVTFILGPAEIERGFISEIPDCIPVLYPGSLAELADILKRAVLYLGNDSGVSHVASMCGARCVVLFGPTDPDVWRPVGDGVIVVGSCDGGMEGIGVGEVVGVLS